MQFACTLHSSMKINLLHSNLFSFFPICSAAQRWSGLLKMFLNDAAIFIANIHNLLCFLSMVSILQAHVHAPTMKIRFSYAQQCFLYFESMRSAIAHLLRYVHIEWNCGANGFRNAKNREALFARSYWHECDLLQPLQNFLWKMHMSRCICFILEQNPLTLSWEKINGAKSPFSKKFHFVPKTLTPTKG